MKKIGKNRQAKRCAPSGLALRSPNTVFVGDSAFQKQLFNKGFKTPKGLFVLPTGRTVSLEGCAAVRICYSSMANPD
jgi:hypothetical protein